MPEVIRYAPCLREEWDELVKRSKNGTFLHLRGYMDYHADRFRDFSLMLTEGGRPFALLPACIMPDGTLHSHAGLTYGALITTSEVRTPAVCEAFRAVGEFLRGEGVKRVIYKAVPHIYHSMPAEEDLYALTNVCHARLAVRDVSSAIVLPRRMPFALSRRKHVNRARRFGIDVGRSTDIAGFWRILNDNLINKYGVPPVHSEAELQLLAGRFPHNIRLYAAHTPDGRMVGGTIIYMCGRTMHTQYISATPEGKEMGAIDLLFHHIINEEQHEAEILDFGKSTESGGAVLNEALIFQKEGFGARAVCYDHYHWDL